jgi:hypothetical protein
MNFNEKKIDMVFTYVNGNDQIYIKKKNKYLKNDFLYFNPSIRYENLDEIIYSVNSVIINLPWINKIYIVTDNQIPPINKLLILSDKVVIIDHKQIIPKKYLPTFYSDVIESYLHNIPKLSEIFLYNNDDCFNIKKIKKKDFVKDKKLIINTDIYSKYILFFLTFFGEYFVRNYNTIKIFKKYNIILKEYIISHQTKILRKSTLKKIENIFKSELHKLRINKFRNGKGLNYLFLAINYENYINNNIIVKLNFNNTILTDGNYLFLFIYLLLKLKLLSIKFLKKEFVCINNVSIKNKTKFIKVMKMLKLI